MGAGYCGDEGGLRGVGWIAGREFEDCFDAGK